MTEQGIQVYYGFIIGSLGLLLGSFLNCTAYRIVRKQDFVRGRSRCTCCGHVLSGKDLIPVASFLMQRGRCRYCGEKISIRYPVSELLFMGLVLTLYLHQGFSILFIRNLCFTSCLFGLSLVDWESYRIPDGFLLVSLAAWIVSAPWISGSWKQFFVHIGTGIAIGGALLLLSILFDRILGKESMGGGDIKLFSVVALYLGGMSSLFAVFFSCFFGICIGFFRKKIPLAPAISLAAFLMLLYGDLLAGWYLALWM